MEQRYLNLLQDLLNNGQQKGDRTGTGTLSLFGYQMRTDLQQGFPLLTTKKVAFKSVLHELLWFISGSTNIKYLLDNDVKIWNEWTPAYKKGGLEMVKAAHAQSTTKVPPPNAIADLDIGPAYGFQWRNFGAIEDPDYWEGQPPKYTTPGIDQLADLIERIKTKPEDRRLIITAWNPRDVPQCSLPPCHCFMQFYVINGRLSCQMYQRSADVFLGVPFNIASYALLTHMIAHVCGLKVGEFIHTFGDVHIYNNHMDQVNEQLTREPRPAPMLKIKRKVESIDDFKFEDFEIVGYDPHPMIKAEVAV